MAISAGVQSMISMAETIVVPQIQPALTQGLTALDAAVSGGATPQEISDTSAFITKELVAGINYFIDHVAAGTPPAPKVANIAVKK